MQTSSTAIPATTVSPETNRKPTSNLEFSKWIVVINGGVPLAILIYDAINGNLGANPVSFAIHTTGLLALIFLCLSLLVTPVRVVTGLNFLVSFRRSLGLYAFYYAAAHFAIFFIWDRSLSVSSTVHEILTRVYLIIGTLALVLMMPLAVTSTNGMVKLMGPKRWKLLHQLAYLSVIGGAIHFYMQAKSDKRLPEVFLIAVAILLGYRLISLYTRLWREGAPAAAGKTKVAGMPTISNPLAKVTGLKKFWSGQLRLANKFRETPDVQTFRLVAADGGPLPFVYTAGQYLNLSVNIDGKKIHRSYTIASSPTRSGYCELSIKREANGIASPYLHDHLQPGDLLNISAPAGKLTFDSKTANSIVLIAGGVGITPLMSVVRDLTDRCWDGDIYFIFSGRNQQEIIFHQELSTLAMRFPNLHLTITLSRESDPAWAGGKGRITPELLQRAVPDLSHKLVHICGPIEMMDAVIPMLKTLGVAESNIKSEVFASPPSSSAGDVVMSTESETAEDSPATDSDESEGVEGDKSITFAKTGQTATSDGSISILESAEAAGVDIEYECRSGICGTCKIKLLSGRVDMEIADALSKADKANNIILACQAKPLGNVSVGA